MANNEAAVAFDGDDINFVDLNSAESSRKNSQGTVALCNVWKLN